MSCANKDSNGTGNVFFRGKSWYHRVKNLRPDGSIQYTKKGGFSSKEEAEYSFKDSEAAFERARSSTLVSLDASMELSEYLCYWLDNIYRSRVKASTYALTAYVLYELLIPSIDQNVKLRNVSVEYINAVLERVSVICDSSGNKCRELLNIAFDDAKIRGCISRNIIPLTKTYRRKKPNIQVLDKNGIRSLLKAACSTNWYLEILLALFMGLRKGEIRGLRFSDFNLKDRTVEISRQLSSNPVIERGGYKIKGYKALESTPKTRNGNRIIRVPDLIMEELEKRKQRVKLLMHRCGKRFSEDLYVSCGEGGLPCSVNAINNVLSRICSKQGLPHISVHGLRHMYATILLEQGVPLVKISALLGHSSVHTTFEYYCEVMDENGKIMDFINSTF